MTFSIKESLKFGWEQFKKHRKLLLVATGTLVAIEVAAALVGAGFEEGSFEAAVVEFIRSVTFFVVGAGYTLITLKVAKGEHSVYRDLIPPFALLWRYFVASILFAAMVGAIVLVVGGLSIPLFAQSSTVVWGMLVAGVGVVAALYLALRYSMAFYAVLEGTKIVESFKKSAVVTHGVKWKLIALIGAVVVVNLLGALCLLVGLLVTVPVTSVAYAHVYRTLKAHAGHIA